MKHIGAINLLEKRQRFLSDQTEWRASSPSPSRRRVRERIRKLRRSVTPLSPIYALDLMMTHRLGVTTDFENFLLFVR